MKAVHFVLPVSNKKRVKQLILARLRQNAMSQMSELRAIIVPFLSLAAQDHKHCHVVHTGCDQHMTVPYGAVKWQVIAQMK